MTRRAGHIPAGSSAVRGRDNRGAIQMRMTGVRSRMTSVCSDPRGRGVVGAVRARPRSARLPPAARRCSGVTPAAQAGAPRRDLWLGLAALILYLLVWNDVAAGRLGRVARSRSRLRQPGLALGAARLRAVRAGALLGRRRSCSSALAALLPREPGARRGGRLRLRALPPRPHPLRRALLRDPGPREPPEPLRRRRRPSALRRVPRPRPLGGRRAAPRRRPARAMLLPSSSRRASHSAPSRAASRRSRTAWRCCSCPRS